MRLENKTAVITGGAKGIGFEMCKLFSQEGARVISVDMAEAMSSPLDGVEFYRLDVTDTEGCAELVGYVSEKYGKIDILVNNAGITRDAMTRKMTDEQWDLVLDVDLKGAFNLVRIIGPQMEANGYGAILNISSVVGVSGNAGQTNYSASKAGIIGFTKSLAKEVASRNITVNAVAPGFIQTKMTEVLKNEVKDEILKQIPLKRFGTTEDVAKTVKFLVSEDSSYITGQVINIDGGMLM